MRLKNKKTGEIIEAESCNNTGGCISIYYEEKDGQIGTKDCYTSLAELNEEWEDVPEEPKGTYFINTQGDVQFWDSSSFAYPNDWTKEKQIGNYFETEEEAEKAVEKLKAWKRLKDVGCRFILDDNFAVKFVGPEVKKIVSAEEGRVLRGDYRLLFGDEE